MTASATASSTNTVVSIDADAFHINGRPTYPGRYFNDHKIEG